MKQSKIVKCEDEHNNLIRLLKDKSPEERQSFLNDIDYILCEICDFKYDDLPWRNIEKQNENWDKLMRNLRISITKICLEYTKKERTLH